MPTLEVIFHRLAAREYRLAREWYAERSPDVAGRFQTAVDRAVERIVTARDSLPPLGENYRRVRVSRFPYVLVFRELTAEAVMVVAVAHTSRRPRYWRRRR